MSRRFGVIISVLAIATLASTFCQAEPQLLLTRHVREVVAKGEAKVVGRLPATQSLKFDIVLPLRDPAGLENFLPQLYDPASTFYHQFLTPHEFTARFGPRREDWDALVAFSKGNGFEIVGGTRDGRDLQLIGTVKNIESAFHLTMGLYQDPTEDRTFFAVDREPTVDLPFPLWHISGLDNDSKPHPLYVKKNDYAKAHGIDPDKVVSQATTGSGPSSSFLGSDMRAAYYQGTALTGSGQNIALFEFAGTDLADLTTYYNNVGQTEPYTPTLISTGGYATTCTYSGGKSKECDDTEQTLDMTQAMGMAPGSTMLYMYVCGDVLASGSGNISDTDCISAMVTDTAAPLSKQISCSWGWDPADPSTLDPYFEQMASQGQNFFAASGDDSAWCSTETSDCYPWPADDANVVSVGGTDLTTSKAAGPWASETAWADSGGGISPDDIAIPSWQQLTGVITTSNKGSTTYRNGPDVSANANFTFYVCADQTTCTANKYGGTSFAAPMWAGYLALANQQATVNGDTIGFINPIIYPAALTASYGTYFHDVASGSCGTYTAITGYDLCTGWGSPNTTGLINLLAPATNLATTTAVSSSTNPSVSGQSVSFTANVTASSGTPTGTVQFTIDGSNFGSAVTLASGSATSGGTSTLSVGTHTVTAVYSGSAGFLGSTGTLNGGQVVNQAIVNVIVATSPTGLTFAVDGTNYTTTQSFTWTIGASHTIATTTPQTPSSGTQDTFTSWSDGGALSHSVTASAGTTAYTAAFSTQYMLTTAVSPSASGTVSPATGYQASGASVPLTATANAGYVFANWTSSPGPVTTPTSTSTTITMSAPESVTANFTALSPGIYSPLNNSTLAGSSVMFQWGGYPGATNYWIDVGSTVGGNSYYQSGTLSGTTYSQTVNTLPVNDSTVYVTWYYMLNGSWISNPYTYTAFGGDSNKGAITSPVPNSTLSGASVTFTWSAGSGATAYWLDIGNVAGGNQYYQSGNLGNVLTTTASGLPTNGSTVFVTLYSLVRGTWLSNVYTYTSYSPAAAGGVMQTPTPGSTLSGSSVTFDWTVGAGATAYWLDAGSTAGGNQYFQSGNLGNVLTVTVNGLPIDGSTVYVTLYSLIGGSWVNNAYTYTAYNASGALAAMQTPVPGSVLSGNTATFTWSADTNATGYWLDIGTVAGGNQYYQSGNLGKVLATTVNSLPANNSTIYVTLYSLVGGQWFSNSYTYVSGP